MSYHLFLAELRNLEECRAYLEDESPYAVEELVNVRPVSEFKTAIREKVVLKLISNDYQFNDNDGDRQFCTRCLYLYCVARDIELSKQIGHSSWPGNYGKYKKFLSNMQMPEEDLETVRESFLNKRVRIKRATGTTTLHENFDIISTLPFLGNNEFFPVWELCTTIDGLPIRTLKRENNC